MIDARERPWPPRHLELPDAVLGYFGFLHTTAVNKVAGLTEAQARSAPIPTSPALSPLGLIQHLTAVYRQHLQIHLAGKSLPTLWPTPDTTADFAVADDDTAEAIIDRFDDEFVRATIAIATTDPDTMVTAYGEPVRAGRLLIDVLQEVARHVGHLDLVRELIDGSTGE